MSKKNFIFLIIFLIALGFLIFNFRETGVIGAQSNGEDVLGWAWSENIGWINFNSLKAYLRFNEGEGTITYDKTVNHNDGTIHDNEGDQWVDGKYGKALQFDGVDDYVRIPNSPSLNLTSGITIDAWVKGSAAGFSSTQRTTGAGGRDSPQFQVVGDKVYYAWREQDASGYYQLWIGSMNTDGTGWTETKLTNTTSTFFGSVTPQLQVVGDKIYYVWSEDDGTYYRIFIAKTKTDGTVLSTAEIRKSQQEIFGSQFQVVGDKIYFAWTEWDSHWNHFYLWTGSMDINFTGWIWGPIQRTPPGGFWPFGLRPQFQVAGDKIYYVFESNYSYPCSNTQIWTAESDINGSGWDAVVRTGTSPFCPPYYDSYAPQLQVVGNKIYYIWYGKGAANYYQIWTGEMNTDGTAWSATQRTTTTSTKTSPQLQVVGDKIYYTWEEGLNIWTAEMNTNGTDWIATKRATSGREPQLQVVGSKIYYFWAYSDKIYTGEMNSNVINKGDFYGIGVKDNKVIGFINAGIDGFKYKGEAIADTAGATVGAILDSDWNHVKLTYDGTSLQLYLNEILQDTYSFTQDINVNPFDLIIGDGFVGTIDEVKIDSPYPYGVSINPSTGNLSGYAWSENIGWIDFNPDLTNRPGSPSYSACLDLPWAGQHCEGLGDWQVGGWARALAYGDGWDGWIKLRDTALWDGVWIDASVSPKEFRDWAWGSDVVGWISFNHLNCDPNNDGFSDGIGACPPVGTPIPNYKVITYFVLPEATPLPANLDCCCYGCLNQVIPGSGISVTLNWTYSHPEGYSQAAYEVWVDDDSDFGDTLSIGKFNHMVDPGSSPAYTLNLNDDQEGDWLTELAWNTTYYWKVRVRNTVGMWSEWSAVDSFDIPPHAWPYVNFTPSPKWPSVNEIVTFNDNSECYDTANNPYPCSDLNPITGTNNTYSWDFGDGNTSSDLGDTSHAYSTPGVYTVELSITDADPGIGTCSKTQQVTVTLPLPEWKEVAPF